MPRKPPPTDTPIRIYTFGCQPPTGGKDLLEQQLTLAHQYRNKLIEIERERRERMEAAVLAIGDVGAAATRVDEVKVALAGVRTMIKSKRKTSRKAVAEDVERAKALAQELRVAMTDLHRIKHRVREDPGLRATRQIIESQARQQVRDARAVCGVYWGTYVRLEADAERSRKSYSAAPPRYRRYDGSGQIAVQIQKGMSIEELFNCEDRRIRIRPVPTDTYERPRHRRRIASRTVLWIRAGSERKEPPQFGDPFTPLWIEFPVILHRPLPKDASIKWAWVSRRRVGYFDRYQLQLLIESESFRIPRTAARPGTVSVDLGWRRKPDGSIRVAYWVDEENRTGELLVPVRAVEGLQKADELRAVRDTNISTVINRILSWIAEHSELPQWFRDHTREMAKWKAAGRLSGLLRDWNEQRFAGDEAIVALLDEWQRQDRHLHWWEANQRRRRAAFRREEYRRFAADLAARYGTILLPKLDLRVMRVPDNPEEGAPSEGRAVRRLLLLAAPGELRTAIKAAANRSGAQATEVPAMYSTQTCNNCGERDERDPSDSIIHVCQHCGASWDQDYNGCLNRLRAFVSADQIDR